MLWYLMDIHSLFMEDVEFSFFSYLPPSASAEAFLATGRNGCAGRVLYIINNETGRKQTNDVLMKASCGLMTTDHSVPS